MDGPNYPQITVLWVAHAYTLQQLFKKGVRAGDKHFSVPYLPLPPGTDNTSIYGGRRGRSFRHPCLLLQTASPLSTYGKKTGGRLAPAPL